MGTPRFGAGARLGFTAIRQFDLEGPVPPSPIGGEAPFTVRGRALPTSGLEYKFVFTSHSSVSLLAACCRSVSWHATRACRRNNFAIWEAASCPSCRSSIGALLVRAKRRLTAIESLPTYPSRIRSAGARFPGLHGRVRGGASL